MTIEFSVEGNKLVMFYTPEAFSSGILEKYRQEKEIIIKRCFNVTLENEFEIKDDSWYDPEETIAFVIGEKLNNYFKLDKSIFGTDNTFYFHETFKFHSKLFIAHRDISILHKIDRLIKEDVFWGGKEEKAIPELVYNELLQKFPTSHELTLYSHKRISQVLRNFFDGLGSFSEKYENYLNNKLDLPMSQVFCKEKELKLSILKTIYTTITQMIKSEEGFSEKQWQEVVKEALLLIYPKYITAERELIVGNDGRNNKRPDFLLVDAGGFVDVLEIKKPNDQKLITKTEYRNNFVADRDLAGAIVQVEKYVHCLLYSGKHGEEKLQKLLKGKIPESVTIRIVNPQGMLLMGRSEGLNSEQLYDLQIIKRQHKNIVDILTYDDLIERLKNMILQLECAQ